MRFRVAGILLWLLLVGLPLGPAFAAPDKTIAIAVLPFENLSYDKNLSWLGRGFAETLNTKLSNVSAIKVVERTRLADAFKELKLQSSALVDPKTAANVGRVIGAQFIIVGSFQKAGARLKADARLVDVQTSVVSKGADVTGGYSSVLELQAGLALKLAAALGRTLSPAEAESIGRPEAGSLKAYELTMRGIEEYRAGHPSEAIELFTRAIEQDPRYAQAHYYLGLTYQYLTSAMAEYGKAIELSPLNSDYYLQRGDAYQYIAGDLDRAMADYDKAISLNPTVGRYYLRRGLLYQYTKSDPDHALADYRVYRG